MLDPYYPDDERLSAAGRRVMEMYQIRYFLAVCETLNFTRAAELCNVTQPALTRAIQKLEEELGGLLLRRERNLTHLTDFGRLLQPQLRQIMVDAESAKSTARNFLKLEDAALKLGVMCTIGPLRFAAFLGAFRQAQAGIEINIVEGVPGKLCERLLEGELDLAVMAQPEAFDERLEKIPLYRERFMIGFATGHRFEAKNAVDLAELEGESYLLRASCEYKDHLRDLCRARGVSNRRAFASERDDWIQSMVAAGMGVCFLPEYSATCPGVVMRPILEPEVAREVSLLYIAGRRFSPAVAAFVRAIKSYNWQDVTIAA
jgi:LysR family transcriptional regulator, hydrogen peroxide-inducible genes activator